MEWLCRKEKKKPHSTLNTAQAHLARRCSSKQKQKLPLHAHTSTHAADQESSKQKNKKRKTAAKLIFTFIVSVVGEASFHFDTGKQNEKSARQRQDHADVDSHDVTLSFLIRQIKIALFVFLLTNILYFFKDIYQVSGK